MRIAIDARAATETAAGRGRYVRELLRHMPGVPGDREIVLFGTTRWACPELDGDPRFRWRLARTHPLAWPPYVAGRAGRSFDALLATGSYLLAALARAPTVAVVWDLAAFDRRYGTPAGASLERLTAPLAARRAARLAAISDATRAAFEARFPRAHGRTAVVHPGADARFSRAADRAADSAARARHGLPQSYVLAVGTLEPRKNLPRLIEAFAALPDDVRGEHELVLAGAGGWATDATSAGLARHRDVVRALGFVPDEDLPALYRGATAVAYPSLDEGFGLPVLEAMQCGAPVLTSGVSSMPEVGGDAVRYADPEDVGSIRDGLTELLCDAALRQELARRGPERAARFSWMRSAEEMTRLLEEAAGR